jgi:hypothetical protein
MTQFVTPEGYMPYRLFSYTDADVACLLRPEQFVGLHVTRPSANMHNAGYDRKWVVEVRLKDNILPLNFGFGADSEGRVSRFISSLRDFLEEDALRNSHNAVMRKGKTNG